jgi:hypothetical protein
MPQLTFVGARLHADGDRTVDAGAADANLNGV